MQKLDDIKKIEKLDPEDMYHKIIHLPEHILNAYQNPQIHLPSSFGKLNPKKIKRIVICGMGGSAISADIAKAAFGNLIPVEVVKDYNIPFLNEETLVITISYSGNTEETLSCLRQAIEKTDFIAAITSGGTVKKLVDEKYCWLELPIGLPPRSAIGHLFFSLVKLLETFAIIPSQELVVKQIVADLIKKAGAISVNTPTEENIAKTAAIAIKGKIPIIYSSSPSLAPLAYRWKCQINENAKYPAFWHYFPEMNHNESEGWEAKNFGDRFIPIVLSRMNEEENYKKRIRAFKKIFGKIDVKYLEYFVEGDSLIEEIFSLIYLGDMISFYLAILQEVNPTTIEFINFLKKEISE
ncbi:MAG: bifunctional phosphoglucose/phosphomannose isomerase [Candidatus Cloacimonadota bacterium]|nr:MAG: bifunctional phosphoglucose/phosphomannose isomerase [Candidatus Cloacimonadota bacterium]